MSGENLMALIRGEDTPEAKAGAMLLAEGLLYLEVLAKAWGAK